MVAAAGATVNDAVKSSRERVLERIRKANLKAAAPQESIPRDYDRSSSQTVDKTLALFEERLRDYDARIFAVRREEVAAKAAEILSAGNRRRIAVPAGLPAVWQAAGVEWILDGAADGTADHELSFDALNAVDGVMTAATAGVAVSGSIVLQHGRRRDVVSLRCCLTIISASSKLGRWWRRYQRASRDSTQHVRSPSSLGPRRRQTSKCSASKVSMDRAFWMCS